MIMIMDSVKELKRFLGWTSLDGDADDAGVYVASGQDVVFSGRWGDSQRSGPSRTDHTVPGQAPLAERRLQRTVAGGIAESGSGQRQIPVHHRCDTLRQSGKKTENTYSTGNRKRRSRKGRRYGKHKHARKSCHSFTFGLLITPSGYRLPFQIPHYTKEYCKQKGLTHRTTAESAAELIRSLPLPEEAEVIVLGDTAYEAKVVRQACDERNYPWIFPINPQRVYDGPKGDRPQVRSRLKDWTSLSLKTIRLRASTGKYAEYRRLSRWRVGPKMKPRVYHAHQEIRDVRSVGRVQLVFSTMKPDLKKATADDVKILMTSATGMSVSEVIELYSLRWQIELFFKEMKSTLGFDQYRFKRFEAVEGWVKVAITTVLYLEWHRARQLTRRRIKPEVKRWWSQQRLHGLCESFCQQTERSELKFLSDRLKTSGGIAKLKRLLQYGSPGEYRIAR